MLVIRDVNKLIDRLHLILSFYLFIVKLVNYFEFDSYVIINHSLSSVAKLFLFV